MEGLQEEGQGWTPPWPGSALGPLAEWMGITIVEASPDLVRGWMPVERNTQPFGLLHGGASCVLVETLASIGATLHAHARGAVAVGVDLNATHHRAVRTGRVEGTARALHRGTSMAGYEVVITDVDGRRVCTGRLTCLLRAADR
jgi:1,4-dihydroxy-2-naphthoyl-CoA hydrolase